MQLSGSLWLTLDPVETERAIRAAVLLQNDPLDEALLGPDHGGDPERPIELSRRPGGSGRARRRGVAGLRSVAGELSGGPRPAR